MNYLKVHLLCADFLGAARLSARSPAGATARAVCCETQEDPPPV